MFLRDIAASDLSLQFILKTGFLLTLSVQILDEEKKLTEIFIFTLLCVASKGFMEARKAYEKLLNYQKYHEILQNFEILHTQSKLHGEIFKLAKFCNKRIILKSSKQR